MTVVAIPLVLFLAFTGQVAAVYAIMAMGIALGCGRCFELYRIRKEMRHLLMFVGCGISALVVAFFAATWPFEWFRMFTQAGVIALTAAFTVGVESWYNFELYRSLKKKRYLNRSISFGVCVVICVLLAILTMFILPGVLA